MTIQWLGLSVESLPHIVGGKVVQRIRDQGVILAKRFFQNYSRAIEQLLRLSIVPMALVEKGEAV
jgi:hypothetical protein